MHQTRSASFLVLAFAAFVLAGRAQNPLAARWRAIARDASGRFGVAALMAESGQRASLNGSALFPMQSVYTLPISMAVLEKVDHGQLSVDQDTEVRPDEYVPEGKHSPLRDQFPHGTKNRSVT
jgi:beta-lactamase class A